MTKRVAFDVDGYVKRAASGRCFVCEFLRGSPEYEHIEVFRSSGAVVFLNKYPTLFGYLLVAPIQHIEQVTGDMPEHDYLELQRLIYCVSEAVRAILQPERIYILSVGSQAANAHLHWHVAPLPKGTPLEKQQFHALMHEYGVLEVPEIEQQELAANLRGEIGTRYR